MLRFLAMVFGCVHDLEQTAIMLERQRNEWSAKATGRCYEILDLKTELTLTRRDRDELYTSVKQAETDVAKFRALREAASLRAVKAESEAAYYRGIVGNVRRAMERDGPVPTPAEARVHPEQRDAATAGWPFWGDEAKAQYDAAARASLR